MRRVERLLQAIRQPTDNEDPVEGSVGVSDDELLETLNDAQAYLQQELEQIETQPFVRELYIDSVARQAEYTLAARTYLSSNLEMVEYSPTPNQLETYRELRMLDMHERRRVTGGVTYPTGYYTRGDTLVLSPAPTNTVTNGIRIHAPMQLPTLDKRRAKIAARTVSGGQVTALTIAVNDFTTYFPGTSTFSSARILKDDLFSVVTPAGVITARNIPITAIDSGTGVCTLLAYTPESTSETVAVDSYLVAGANATTHSELPIACERYLIAWGKWQLLDRDGHYEDAGKQLARVQMLEGAIKGAWSRISDDIHYIPILNPDYLMA